jgi:hypothetical protein
MLSSSGRKKGAPDDIVYPSIYVSRIAENVKFSGAVDCLALSDWSGRRVFEPRE